MRNYIFVLVAISLFIKCKKEEKEINPSTFNYVVNIYSGFKVALKSNPTTGYSWQWTNNRALLIVYFLAIHSLQTLLFYVVAEEK